MQKKSYILSILSIIILLSVTGCTFPWQKKKVVTPVTNQNQNATTTLEATTGSEQPSGGIKKFKDTQELQAFLIQHANTSGLGMGGGKMISDLATNVVSAPETATVKAGATASTDYSKTNIQVEGVDEVDIMKTDGEYIYLLDYNDLYIIKAKPAGIASVITKITFKSRPQEFYISGDRLVIFGYDNQIFNDTTY